MGADTEALQERGRRLGREAGEVLVVRRDFLSQGKPATGKRPEGVLGGCGGRVERARSEGGAAPVGLEFRIRSLNRGLGHHCVAPEF